MINQKKDRKTKFGNHGFTLIEILIVVMVLGILAMVIVPQITVSTQDAKVSTLQTNLSAMRNAIELYAVQHNGAYPGLYDGVTAGATPTLSIAGNVVAAFTNQLTQYTDINGIFAVTKDSTYKFGPYLKGAALPTNPFTDSATVACDIAIDVITTKALTVPATAWKFYVITGILIANDGGTGHIDL
ncbi:MAG: prepilin-type N-terminal cleavage/methylation domain-containing protein [Deltaproteobacteria bacterium]|uniref:type II secretion system protein n=1 Tax=Desulfobacula sp. TaxID=2593537 RepID=UPI00199F78A7|nr:prepilin-type N-terminal cleavage/methylation domain-containing protein [Candidatus Desulfobacula maris]MBL6993203.1 prepilin-type N-terminal cleavage/methylation domain-containing protein [Desulfobacula sp.]